ncbi:helix-turn-helix transcriptional regulator [Streptomyces sp. NPDC060006]|uniref:helix-turn-helix transcriptional regulator n=1 Tax=unclassified Streptomyces TaxID=2593676 RepID=UPI003674C87C
MGRALQAERIRRNLTQEQVYLAAAVDRVTLQSIEAGRGNPTIVTLLKIAHVLDVPIGRLADGRGPTTAP